MYTNKSKHNVT